MAHPTRTLAALLGLITCVMLLTPATAAPVSATSASAGDVTCTPPSSNTATFNPPLTSTPQSTTVSSSTQYGPCVSLAQPAVTSGTRTALLTQPRSCLDLLTASSITYTITWNTGQTSTVSGNTTTSTAGAVIVFTITGTVTSGLFAGSSALQVNVAPSANILLCTAGLGTVPSIYSTVTLTIT
ncbi:hypothetical protein [Nonomuraea zeae]|uniref:Ig-like domain-containing protein n=1 Tax=Nonomuraea zeae TaxID=1642303 RepID=A0A5S4GFH5_9ACTN|nr:hypothetical protein [Nonomuraea zeae]TMR31723.1 hypothetical protein ETD85_24810 [Nonomuraea zeae]